MWSSLTLPSSLGPVNLDQASRTDAWVIAGLDSRSQSSSRIAPRRAADGDELAAYQGTGRALGASPMVALGCLHVSQGRYPRGSRIGRPQCEASSRHRQEPW